MARHTITHDEMYEYLAKEGWHAAALSYGDGSSKKLEVSTKGMFRVTDHDNVTYEGASLGMAVEAYNQAP